jgi:hypothetical protein
VRHVCFDVLFVIDSSIFLTTNEFMVMMHMNVMKYFFVLFFVEFHLNTNGVSLDTFCNI